MSRWSVAASRSGVGASCSESEVTAQPGDGVPAAGTVGDEFAQEHLQAGRLMPDQRRHHAHRTAVGLIGQGLCDEATVSLAWDRAEDYPALAW